MDAQQVIRSVQRNISPRAMRCSIAVGPKLSHVRFMKDANIIPY